MTQPDPAELLAVAIAAAASAAELAQRYQAEGIGEVATKSTATDPVTAADRAVERQIVALLRERRPDDVVLGEEYGDGGGPAHVPGQVRWVIDPIDGTVNFVYGLPQYAVSIAAEIDGVSLAGVVRNAATGDEWTATRGGGAWYQAPYQAPHRGPGAAPRRLSGSRVSSLAQTLVATGFGYDAARRAHQATVLAQVLPRVRDIRRFGAAALDLCLAAEGKVDAYFEKGLGAWDRAAGGLIAEEAGLLVTGLRGAPPGPTMVLAAPPAVHAELHALLVELDADGGP